MSARKKNLDDLRSQRWFGATDLRSFGHRSRMLQMGYERADFTGKPIVGIINTWSDINPCHQHFRERVEHVKRGVWQAGASRSSCRRSRCRRTSSSRPRCSTATSWPWRWRSAAPASRGRRGADGRMRQDHARHRDGRHLHEPADGLPGRRGP
ncbi:dihydroxy-acid dehydratase domain-containing protein [Methylobacterium oryzae CBMB20]